MTAILTGPLGSEFHFISSLSGSKPTSELAPLHLHNSSNTFYEMPSHRNYARSYGGVLVCNVIRTLSVAHYALQTCIKYCFE